MRFLRTSCLALPLMLAAATAGAQSTGAKPSIALVSAADPNGLVAAMMAEGFTATLETDKVGDPVIRSRASGSSFSIYFYGCTEHADCTSLGFSSGWDLADGTTHEVINSWNTDRLVGQAYVDDEMDPWLTYFVVTEGGISTAAFASSLRRWDSALGSFQDLIDF
jgi:hypothetical protein